MMTSLMEYECSPGIGMNRHHQREPAGQIQVIFGPMFSGKTTELIRRLKRYQIAKYRCLVIKYAKDIRYDKDGVSTHDKQTLTAKGCLELSEITVDEIENFDVIGIDEGQFFPDVVGFCERMADSGKIVIIAALDGTYQRKGFGNILQLVPLAESIVKLNAVCMICFGTASFTKRTTMDEEVEVIGGADKYLAVCRDCYRGPVKVASPNPKLVSPWKQRHADALHRPILSDKTNQSNPTRKLFTSPNGKTTVH
ncbi:thymidine kinase, cytosolic-like [Tubulanus polymorphus]|uniref:thymidine kinase, cytosolic-like n=1 Tax=Tubulanus polymorphus TaxID=672921 RepID=UPI003DA5EE32